MGSDSGVRVMSDVQSLFVAHAADLHRYAARRVGRDLADDVVAETFRQAIESFPTFDASQGSARGWLFGISTNLLRRHWRTEKRRLQALARSHCASADHQTDPLLRVPERLDAVSEASSVLDAVALLEPADRELLVLVAWEHMTSAEAAAVVGVPAGTVRSRLHRIRGQLDHARKSGTEAEGDQT